MSITVVNCTYFEGAGLLHVENILDRETQAVNLSLEAQKRVVEVDRSPFHRKAIADIADRLGIAVRAHIPWTERIVESVVFNGNGLSVVGNVVGYAEETGSKVLTICGEISVNSREICDRIFTRIGPYAPQRSCGRRADP